MLGVILEIMTQSTDYTDNSKSHSAGIHQTLTSLSKTNLHEILVKIYQNEPEYRRTVV